MRKVLKRRTPKRKAPGPVVAVVQARMGSTRLPGKVMMEVCGEPILWHVVNRLKAATEIDSVVVATSTDPADSVIEAWCVANGVGCVRGSLEDVLDRYYTAARACSARTIVRITADCPLLDPELVDTVIRKFARGGYDLVSVDGSHPDGLDAEVFSIEALAEAHATAVMASEREHVTPYIWKNPQLFRLSSVTSAENLSHMRWTVDDEKDFELVKSIYEGIGPDLRVFSTAEILGFLDRNPEILKINSGTRRNEGYAKSLREDHVVGSN